MPLNSLFSCGYPYGSLFCDTCPIEEEICPNKGLRREHMEPQHCPLGGRA
ncbi:MAG TPA: hypothetical protein VGK06_01540 [Methanosarcina sp.]